MKKLSLLLAVLFATLYTNAQNVAINNDGTVATSSAMLDVKSTTKGFMMPRVTSAQRTTIASPALGLLVFDTDTKTVWAFDGSAWKNLYNNSGGGSLTLPYSQSVNAAGNAFSITNTGGGAIEGITNAVSSNGIRGIATVNGSNGVYGGTTSSNGVGVRGESNTGTGIVAYGGSGIGLNASSLSGTGIYTNSTSGLALNVNGNLKIAGGNTNPGGGKVLTSDANGNASWQVPANTPKVAFKAYGIASGQSVVPDQTIKRVHFGGEKYDLGNTYNLLAPGATPTNESSTFTVPVTGLYHFDFSLVLIQDDANQETERAIVRLIIERNGQTVGNASSYGTRAYDYINILNADDAILYQQSSTEHLLAGDKVYIEVYHSTGSTVTFLFTDFAWFNSHLVMTL